MEGSLSKRVKKIKEQGKNERQGRTIGASAGACEKSF